MPRYAINEETLTDIADAIRRKTDDDATLTPSEMVTAIDNLNVQYDDWHKPDDWPDLESIELPGSYTQNTIYLLYDRECGFDQVSFESGSMPCDVYKGQIIDGDFVGELVAERLSGYYRDTLTERFTVYKIIGGNHLLLEYGAARTYTASLQSVVWVYGEAPTIGTVGNSQETNLFSVHTKRFKLTHLGQNQNITTIALTLPTDSLIGLESMWLGDNTIGDFGGKFLTRTGNGAMYAQRNKNAVTIKNATFSGITGNAFACVPNLVFENVSFPSNASSQIAYNSSILKSIIFRNCNFLPTSIYYWFTGCRYLEYCDLSSIDFSGVTSLGNPFGSTYSLRTLILNSTWKLDLNLSSCYRLTRESALGIINILPEVQETKTLTLPYGLKKYVLTEEEIAVATEKGWTVA